MSVIDYQICLARTDPADETWISVQSLGGSGLRRSLRSCDTDHVTFTVNSATALTDAQAFAYHAEVRLRKVVDGTPSYWFCGRVASVPRAASGRAESYTLKIEGPWAWFEACTFRQPWAASAGGVTKPRVILFCDSAGARITTGAQIIEAAELARAAGAPIAEVTSSTVATGFTPPFDEQLNVKVADVICKALAYHPHAVCWFDYTQRTPVLHVATRSSLTAVSRSVAGRSDISISQRTDMQVPAIAICYERANSVDGEAVVETTIDYAPTVANETDEARDARLGQADVVWACYSLAGSTVTTVSQSITAAAFPFPLTNKAWWRAHVPMLNDVADDDLAIANARRMDDSSLSNLLVQGERQPWMSVSVEPERVCADISYIRRAVVDGSSVVVERGTKSVTLNVRVTGAPAGTTVYRCPVSVDDGEPVPSGVAAELYAEWSQLHFQGAIIFIADDPAGDCVPGRALNLSGGRTEWATMAAMVIACEESVDDGTSQVEFGIPDWTDVDSRVAFARATRTRNTASSLAFRSGVAAGGVTGPLSAAVERDGATNASYVRQLFTASSTPRHMIVVDADAVSKSVDASVASILQPREILLPYDDNGTVKARFAQALVSAAYGDPVAIGGAQLSDDAPPAVGASGAAGESTEAARADHTHEGVQLAASAPPAVAASGAVGEASAAARADHTHAGVQLGASAPAAISGAGAAGTSTDAARADHTHAIAFAVPDPGPDTGAPVQDGGTDVLPAPAGALGTSGFHARRDHVHPVNVDDTVTPAAVGSSASPGTSRRYARADHVHSGAAPELATATPPAIGTAAVGTATKAAREDHTHALGAPSNPGDCPDLGVAGEGSSDNADTATWTSGGADGCDLYVVCRPRFNNATSGSDVLAFLRLMRITPDGRIYSLGAEQKVIISPTVAVT